MPRIHRTESGCAKLKPMLQKHGFIAAIAMPLFAVQGCTFVTACPTDRGNPASSGGASVNGGAGDSAAGGATHDGGGSGNQGGAGPDAGASGDGLGGGSQHPLPSGKWINVTSNLAGISSECGNLGLVSAKPDEDLLIAGIALNGLFKSSDGGASWTAMGQGKGSDKIVNRPTMIVYDPDVPKRFWESGTHNSFGVFRTDDDGKTLINPGPLPGADLVSVDFTDPDRQTLLAGDHEQSHLLYRSTDGGATWGNIGTSLPDATNCTLPLVINSKVHLVGCGGYGGGPTGIYRTTNGGSSWKRLTASGGGGAPLRTTDGTIYWPGVAGGVIARSDDEGASFVDVGADGLSKTRPVELPDGRIVTVGNQYLMLSEDRGEHWRQVSVALPYNDAIGVTYSVHQRAFFIWHFNCGTPPLPVLNDAIMRYDFDYQTM